MRKKLQVCNKCGCFLVGGLMSKQLRVTLVVGVAIAISLFVSSCGGNPSTTPANGGTTPTSGGSIPAKGVRTPRPYNCLQGSSNATGSTAPAALGQAEVQQYETQSSN